MTPMLSRYLLLDGAKIENLPKNIYSLEDNPSVEWLYHTTRYEALFDVGPALILLSADSDLERAFVERWQYDAGIMLESDAPLPSLTAHLRSLVHARLTGDVSVLFRYYDPRVMRHWLPTVSTDEKDHMMGPVSRVRLPVTTEHGEQWIVREQDRQSARHYGERPWLYLDEQQLQELNQGKLELFDETLLEHVRNYFPECMAAHSLAEQLKWAASCRESAARYGYSTPSEVSRWAALVAAHGKTFPQALEHQTYREILQHPTLNATQRMDALLVELHRHLLRTDKESFL